METEHHQVSAASTEAANSLILPEGSQMMIHDGEEYVTIVQDGQTYAIPLSEYQSMQPGGTITIQAEQIDHSVLTGNPPQVVIQTTPPTIAPPPSLNAPPTPIPTPVVVSSPVVTPVQVKIEPNTSNMKMNMLSGPQPHLKPWSGSSLEPRRFKPISVENWGIFLLNRLHDYYQKKEYTDLTLRFPSRNAQIKVHKAVVNACSDYFVKAETNGLIEEGGILDMPDIFLPELVSPAIRFMYTGRLELKNHNVVKLKETANALGMPLLTKLVEAQIHAPLTDDKISKPRRNSLDPVRQIRKIRKIEKKFERQEKKDRIKQEADKKAIVIAEKTLPGKKLPIWKKRENPAPAITTTQDNPEEKLNLTNVSTRNYGKFAKEQIKMPRQLREIQENLNFEKVRSQTVSDSNKEDMNIDEIKEFMDEQRRNDVDDEDDDYFDNDAGLDYDEAQEEDDDQEMEQTFQEFTTPTKNQSLLAKNIINSSPHSISPAKPILKSTEKEGSVPRKSVRFSLRPGNITTTTKTETELITPDPAVDNSSTISGDLTENFDNVHENEDIAEAISEVNETSPRELDVDKTVEEFSKVVEEEEKVLHDQTTPTVKKSRKGRLIVPPNLDMPQPQTTNQTKVQHQLMKTTETPPPSSSSSPLADQTSMISELMKKNPELFKDNKPVKIKVMTKDANGKNTVKFITVKAASPSPGTSKNIVENQNKMSNKRSVIDMNSQNNYNVATSTPKLSQQAKTTFNNQTTPVAKKSEEKQKDVYGIRSTPPVIYTGKRGRPPKVRPNQVDPHEKERQEIAQKFSDSSPKIVIQTEKTSNSTEQPGKSTTEDTYTTFDQVTESDETTTNTSNMNSGQLDPSSEAEALSHVASGIAASLGVLAAESPSNVADSEANNGPLSGLTDLTTENYEVSGNNQVFESRGVKRARNDMETSSEENSPAKKVTKLAMEWTEDEEEENNLSSQTT